MSSKVIAQIVAVFVFAHGIFVQGSALAQGAYIIRADGRYFSTSRLVQIVK